MSIYAFKALSNAEQAELTWDKGVYLMHRIEQDIKYILFQFEGIYVECQYDGEQNKLIDMKSFGNTDLLDPYFTE